MSACRPAVVEEAIAWRRRFDHPTRLIRPGLEEKELMFDRDEIAQLTQAAVFGRKQKAAGRDGIVVTSHPIVSRVAVNVLRDGGNAVDAALAASLAQTVVEPHMTTAFGVLSMMHYDRATGATQYING